MITCAQDRSHVLRIILVDIRALICRDWDVQCSLIDRAVNDEVADMLAKMGAQYTTGLKLWSSPPTQLLPALAADVEE